MKRTIVFRSTAAPPTAGEPARVQLLRSYGILDTPSEASFDRIAHLAAELFQAPIALVSLADADRHWFKAAIGTAVREVPHESAFCTEVLRSGETLVVHDAAADPRFAAIPFVTGAPNVRFYAGAPLVVDGEVIGTLDVIDQAPRDPPPARVAALEDLARCVVTELELRKLVRLLEADVRERARIAAELKESRESLAALAATAADAFWETDAAYRIKAGIAGLDDLPQVQARGSMRALYAGRTIWEAAGADPARDPRWARHVEDLAARRPFRDFEFKASLPNGRERWLEASGVPVFAEDGAFLGYRGTSRDVTERKRQEARIRELAATDGLTGLANRRTFQAEIAARLAVASGERPGALLLIDVDRLKEVNDAHGHEIGDALLRAVAQRVVSSVGESGFVARIGGDDFAVLLDGVDGAAGERAAEKITHVAGAPFAVAGRRIHVTLTAGLTVFPQDAVGADAALTTAGMALYHAKATRRGAWRRFEPAMRREIEERRALEQEIREALDGDAFCLQFQPIVDLLGRRPATLEALLRWRHPTRGLVGPDAFIAVAEAADLGAELGQTALRQALAAMAAWRRAGLAADRVAVNLAPSQFVDEGFAAVIAAELAHHGLAATDLELEVTETVLLSTKAQSIARTLTALADAGATVSLDDFGTGYASLAHLKRFPIHRLKIDRSFVAGVQHDAGDAAIVRAMLNLAADLDISAVAEGVETAEQATLLRRWGCRFAQGFLFARPLDEAAVPEFLTRPAAGRARGRATRAR
jgi:diguanylate cyclase (GGDEF)-like protein